MGLLSSSKKITDIETVTIAGTVAGSDKSTVIGGQAQVQFVDPGAIGLAERSVQVGADAVSALADISGRALSGFQQSAQQSIAIAEQSAKGQVAVLTENIVKLGVFAVVGLGVVAVFMGRGKR